jgi:hypothetical protein
LPGRFVDRHGAPFPPAGSIGGTTRVGASVLRLKSRWDAVSAAGPEDVHRSPLRGGAIRSASTDLGENLFGDVEVRVDVLDVVEVLERLDQTEQAPSL